MQNEEHNAVQAALQYFRTGGQRHTADEEESLLPRLRESDAEVFEEIDRLEHSDLHRSVQRLYSARIEFGGVGSTETQGLLSQTARLKQLYSDHIEVEETIVFALASQVLRSRTISAIRNEFRLRRK